VPFADLDPAECQETWDQPITPYGQSAEHVMMTADIGKKLWSFLRRQRNQESAVIVVHDSGDRRALSLAMGIAEGLGWPRSAIVRMGLEFAPVDRDETPPNHYVFLTTKQSRHRVL
jgi:hypothetical protein